MNRARRNATREPPSSHLGSGPRRLKAREQARIVGNSLSGRQFATVIVTQAPFSHAAQRARRFSSDDAHRQFGSTRQGHAA